MTCGEETSGSFWRLGTSMLHFPFEKGKICLLSFFAPIKRLVCESFISVFLLFGSPQLRQEPSPPSRKASALTTMPTCGRPLCTIPDGNHACAGALQIFHVAGGNVGGSRGKGVFWQDFLRQHTCEHQAGQFRVWSALCPKAPATSCGTVQVKWC